MFRIVRAGRLAALQAQADAARAKADATEVVLGRVRVALARAEGELVVLRGQSYLDAEDRVSLRALLRSVRRQAKDREKVAVLFRKGQLVSAHASRQAAEAAAEAEGAPREGWVSSPLGAPLPPEADVAWRVTVLPVQAEQ
ncbi:hypothetical protein H114_00837 [Streptomyces gancidicus BKS 13-15]|uniref:Uncharacterized protein n=1 Tax=Streptomyces gancidicus BKS 13-15 TaxID=1284664 RepID=M3DMB9_STREZ|nr:hypothetical protein [Streptomyces gancidicus]EMF31130.1 hypothetical protein H114_00837 [Streptomyces gancidicus BKS 13-15]